MRLALPTGPLSVVCLGAHPDDIEIGCGGTLLRLVAERECRIRMMVLTGSTHRAAEARRSADVLGAEVELGGFVDGFLPERWGDVKRALHEFAAGHPAPDLLFAPKPDDAHQDHRTLGSLATTVWRRSLVLGYEIPKWDGDLCQPNVYVPLSDETVQAKLDLLNESFGSQHGRDWWDDELFTGLLRLRGVECHARHAEAFAVRKAVLDW